jgi:hypoxanthine phosphoribosyltransferase
MIFRYYWQDVDYQISNIHRKIKWANITPDMLVGVVRGGLIPATLLSYRMELPVRSLQWQRRDRNKIDPFHIKEILFETETGVVIVDDILDSGLTLREIAAEVEVIKSHFPEREFIVNYAVCVKRAELESPIPNLIFGTELADFDWVHFPWGE